MNLTSVWHFCYLKLFSNYSQISQSIFFEGTANTWPSDREVIELVKRKALQLIHRRSAGITAKLLNFNVLCVRKLKWIFAEFETDQKEIHAMFHHLGSVTFEQFCKGKKTEKQLTATTFFACLIANMHFSIRQRPTQNEMQFAIDNFVRRFPSKHFNLKIYFCRLWFWRKHWSWNDSLRLSAVQIKIDNLQDGNTGTNCRGVFRLRFAAFESVHDARLVSHLFRRTVSCGDCWPPRCCQRTDWSLAQLGAFMAVFIYAQVWTGRRSNAVHEDDHLQILYARISLLDRSQTPYSSWTCARGDCWRGCQCKHARKWSSAHSTWRRSWTWWACARCALLCLSTKACVSTRMGECELCVFINVHF